MNGNGHAVSDSGKKTTKTLPWNGTWGRQMSEQGLVRGWTGNRDVPVKSKSNVCAIYSAALILTLSCGRPTGHLPRPQGRLPGPTSQVPRQYTISPAHAALLIKGLL